MLDFTTDERVTSALAYIDPADRETWVKVAMAIYSEMGEAGLPTFDEWSRGASNYSERDCRDVYKSARKPGGVGIGSLFHLAKQGGWIPSHEQTDDERESAEILRAERQRQQAESQAQQEAAAQTEQAAAQSEMLTLWNRAQPMTEPHEYLIGKGLDYLQIALRVINGDLLVPMYNAAAKLQSLQAITRDGGKKYQAGCPVAGAYLPTDGDKSKPLLICEGLATGGSLALATGYQVAVAFSAGNLGKVAEIMRTKHPQRQIVICADDDHAKTRAGEKAAIQAAQAVGGMVALPRFINPTGKTDFNDMHKEQSLEAVKQAVAGACKPAEAWPEPLPLTVQESEEMAFPVQSLGQSLGQAAKAIAEHVGCPEALAGFAVLGAASLCVQTHYKAPHPKAPGGMSTGLYLLALAESSERKSTAERWALLPFRKLERELALQYREALKQWKQDQSEQRKTKGKGK